MVTWINDCWIDDEIKINTNIYRQGKNIDVLLGTEKL